VLRLPGLCGILLSLDSWHRRSLPFVVANTADLFEILAAWGAATRVHSVIASGFALASMPSISATIRTIPSDDDLTLSMIRPTSSTICVGLGEGVWLVVVSIAVILPECAMISQRVTINARKVSEM
jgi:hypothetical protein